MGDIALVVGLACHRDQHLCFRLCEIPEGRSDITRSLEYRRRFGRKAELKAELIARGLRSHKRATDAKPVVGLVGDHICDSIRAHGAYERVFLGFIRDELLDRAACRTEVAIDVGANIGNHSLCLSDLFDRVIAFEPNPLARSLLQINLRMNGIGNVEVRDVGLSDKSGNATLAFNHANLGGATTTEGSGGSRELRSRIKLVAGDDVIDPSVAVGFIKVDVEGAEEAVLKGLEKTIRSHRPILMIEQWEGAIDASDGTSPSQLFLRGLAYSAWELRPSPFFRGRLGKLISVLCGRTDYRLERVERLEKRDYRALFFLPSER